MYSVYGGVQDSTDTTVGTFATGGQGNPRGRTIPSSTHPYANWAVIAWFLIAALGIVFLDRGGFKFMVRVGRG